jgi:hypothetical protein
MLCIYGIPTVQRTVGYLFHVLCDYIRWLQTNKVALVDAVCLVTCITRSFVWLSKLALFLLLIWRRILGLLAISEQERMWEESGLT